MAAEAEQAGRLERGVPDAPDPPAERGMAAGEEALEAGDATRARFGLDGRGLREHTARGVVINAAFQAAFAGLGLVQRFAVAAFLTATEFGVWGLVLTTLLTLTWLKQIGISDKYIQQDEADQELAFQKAFTLEVAYTLGFCVLLAVAVPIYALAYGRPEILLPTLVLSLSLIGAALGAPVWIYFREMRFVRQRVLEGVYPVVSTLVMLPLAAGGAGYWSMIVGTLVGIYAGAAAALLTCPYRLAWRFDRAALREYVRFSWPLLVASGSGVLVVQGTMMVSNYSVGLAGVGAITLASSLIVFAERVDGIISRTIYPAICAVKDRTDILLETFTKSNRLALMWGLPFGVGLALFAPDLVRFTLGDRWEPAVELLQVLGLLVGLRQLGFNWVLFFQARGETRPLALSGVVALVVFVLALAPLLLAFGLTGYMVGMSIAVAAELAVRTRYLLKLFPGFSPARHAARALAPSLVATALVLGARGAVSGERGFEVALAELVLYVLGTAAATLLFERALIREILGYLRGRGGPADQAEAAAA